MESQIIESQMLNAEQCMHHHLLIAESDLDCGEMNCGMELWIPNQRESELELLEWDYRKVNCNGRGALERTFPGVPEGTPPPWGGSLPAPPVRFSSTHGGLEPNHLRTL